MGSSVLLHGVRLGAFPSARGGFFFFNDTATTEIYTLSLHDALPICTSFVQHAFLAAFAPCFCRIQNILDRKSTRLNSSHQIISYAVFCLKTKTPAPITSTRPGCITGIAARSSWLERS